MESSLPCFDFLAVCHCGLLQRSVKLHEFLFIFNHVGNGLKPTNFTYKIIAVDFDSISKISFSA